jgi:hypothetical protein
MKRKAVTGSSRHLVGILGLKWGWILGLPRVMRPLDRTYVGPKPETVL